MKTTVLLFFLFLTIKTHAQVQPKTCADVSYKSVSDCANLKVFFNLKKCGLEKAPVEAQVECKKKSAEASYSTDNRTWKVQFAFKEGKWGNPEWKESSPVNEERPVFSQETTEVKKREIAQEKKPVDLKWGGYFDFRFNSIENKSNPFITHSGQPESGFSIEEAALGLQAQVSDMSFVLDLPIRREKTTAGVSEDSNLILGADRAQAYIKMSLVEDLNLTLGQFDTPYGVELNDSKDRVFVRTGLLFDYALPVTHTGVSLDGRVQSMSYRILAANSNNKGSYGNTATGENQTEVGATVGYSSDVIRAQVGYLTRAIEKSTGEKGGKRDLVDVTFGFNVMQASFDFEWASVSNDNKASKKSGSAFLFLPTYKINDKVLLGLRYEKVTDDVSATGLFEEGDSMGLTVHYKLNDHVQFRSEFVEFNYNTQSGGTEGEQSRVTLTSLFNF